MKAGIITPEEGREFLSNYRSGLYGYTYLEKRLTFHMDYRDTSFPVIHSYLKMQRYFIYLSFNGAQYHGWQIQPNGITVQESPRKSVSHIAPP